MIVISNTSPLTNLAAIGRFDLLEKLFGSLIVTQAVYDEIVTSRPGNPGASELQAAAWIEICEPQNRVVVQTLELELDAGEAHTIALALEIKADLVLLDEQQARRVATRLGLNRTGIVGLLLSAKSRNLLPAIRPVLDQLRNQAGFWLSEQLYREALQLAQETQP